jgi:hypothetical protein
MNARAALTLLPVCILLAPPVHAGDPTDFLPRIPDEANTIAVVKAQALFNSPRAIREGWMARQQLAGSVPVPAAIDTIVTASHWEPANPDAGWMLTQASLTKALTMNQIAALEGATVDLINGQEVVLSPRRGYIVQFDPKTVAVVNPPDRRRLVRWLRFAKAASKPTLGEYLTEAARGGRGAPIVAAIDLQDMIEPKDLRTWLTQTKTLAGNKSELDAALKMLSTIHGVRLIVRVEAEAIPFEVHIDFTEAPSTANARMVKPLFVELIEEMGVGLDEFKGAREQVRGKTITLSGNLLTPSLARVLMLLLGPTVQAPATDAPAPGAPAAAGQANPERLAHATREYFQSVQRFLANLNTSSRLSTNMTSNATWHEAAARRIDQLSTADVDPDMLKYGAEVSRNLRLLAASLKGVPMQVQMLQGQRRFVINYNPPIGGMWGPGWGPGWGGGWGRGPWGARGWGMWGFQPGSFSTEDNFAQVRQAQAEVIQAGAKDREQVVAQMESDAKAIRELMKKKLGIDLGE